MSDFEKFDALLRYEPETGKLFWKRPGLARQFHKEAGSFDRHGYRRICVDYEAYRTHRIVWLLHHKVWPSREIDHINGDRNDNRIENLRDVSRQTNSINSHKTRNSKTGIPGVYPQLSKWKAVKNRKHLGTFNTTQEAQQAWEAAK